MDHLRGVCLTLGLCLATVPALTQPVTAEAAQVERDQAVDALFARFTAAGTPGAAVGIYHKGRQVYVQAYGLADLDHDIPVTPQTVFHVASVSKQFTAFSVALLAREGRLDLDADIRTYLPYVPDFGQVITARHLIHHMSGLRDQWTLFALGGRGIDDLLRQEQVVNMVARQRELNFEPGSAILYSNTGYTLLAEIVRAVSGQTLRKFTSERIFKPLGMTSTFFYDDVTEVVPNRANSYERSEDGRRWARELLNYEIVGSTSLHTTVGDLLKWAGNFTHPIVGDARLIEQIGTPGKLRDGSPTIYAFGLVRTTIAGHDVLIHNGSDAGFNTSFAYFPADDFAITILMNHPDDLRTPLEAIARLYLGSIKPSYGPSLLPVKPDSRLISAMKGHYLADYDLRVSIEQEGDGLVWKTMEDSEAIVFRADGTFDTGHRPGQYMRRVRDERGNISALEVIVMGAVASPQVYRRITADALPWSAGFRGIAGDYRSEELDVTYSLAVEDGKLLARSIWLTKPIEFTPVAQDRFDSADWTMSTIRAIRDTQGKVTGVRVDADRIRNVLLERLPQR